MKRKIKVRRHNLNDEFQTLYEWYEEKLAASDKRAEAFVAELYNTITDRDATIRKQEDDIYKLVMRVDKRNELILSMQDEIHRMQDPPYKGMPIVDELKKTIANLENMVQARNKHIAELQKTVDKLYADLFKKEES